MNTRRTFIGSLLAALGLGGATASATPTLQQGLATELKPYKFARRPKLRLWKLGSLDHRIYPTDEAVQKLADILRNHVSGDKDIDLIWGPDLTVEEHYLDEADVNVIEIIKPDENGRIVIKKEATNGNA